MKIYTAESVCACEYEYTTLDLITTSVCLKTVVDIVNEQYKIPVRSGGLYANSIMFSVYDGFTGKLTHVNEIKTVSVRDNNNQVLFTAELVEAGMKEVS